MARNSVLEPQSTWDSDDPLEDNQEIIEFFEANDRTNAERIIVAQSFIREALFYVIFVGAFTYVTLGQISEDRFDTAQFIQNVVMKDFRKVRDASSFYTWLNTIFVPRVFPLPPNEKYLELVNYRVGKVRLRQLRLRKNAQCHIDQLLSDRISSCVTPLFSTDTESRASYGLKLVCGKETCVYKPRWVWTSMEAVCKESGLSDLYCRSPIIGQRNAVYPTSGFIVDLPSRAENQTNELDIAKADIAELFDGGWIDSTTSFIAVEFSVYNANVRLLTTTQAYVEVLSTGKWSPRISVKTMTLMDLSTRRDVINLIIEVVFAILVITLVIGKIFESLRYITVKSCPLCTSLRLRRQGLEPLLYCPNCHSPCQLSTADLICSQCNKDIRVSHACIRGFVYDLWNLCDIANFSLFCVVISFRFKLRSDLGDLSFEDTNKFLSIYPISQSYSVIGYLNSINILLCYFKIYKYIGKLRGYSMFIRTIEFSAGEMLRFLILAFTFFVGFALSFTFAFGSQVSQYRSWITSGVSLLQMAIYVFDYNALVDSNRFLTRLFVPVFIVCISLVILNVIISILELSYAQARRAIQDTTIDHLNLSLLYFRRRFVDRIFCRAPHAKYEQAVQYILQMQSYLSSPVEKADEDERLQRRDELAAFLRELLAFEDRILIEAVCRTAKKRIGPITMGDVYTLRSVIVGKRRMIKKFAVAADEQSLKLGADTPKRGDSHSSAPSTPLLSDPGTPQSTRSMRRLTIFPASASGSPSAFPQSASAASRPHFQLISARMSEIEGKLMSIIPFLRNRDLHLGRLNVPEHPRKQPQRHSLGDRVRASSTITPFKASPRRGSLEEKAVGTPQVEGEGQASESDSEAKTTRRMSLDDDRVRVSSDVDECETPSARARPLLQDGDSERQWENTENAETTEN